MTLRRHLMLYILLAIAFLIILWGLVPLIIPGNFDYNMVLGSVITLQQLGNSNDSTLSLDISFPNNTNATATQNITEQQGNAIVTSINAILNGNDPQAIEGYIPTALDPEELQELREEQLQQQIEEEEADNDNGGSSSSINNDNDNDDGEIAPPQDSGSSDNDNDNSGTAGSGSFPDSESSSNNDNNDNGDPSWE